MSAALTIIRYFTPDEREIKRSRGIPLWRFWPFGLAFLALMILGSDRDLFLRCIGHPLLAHYSGAYQGQKIAAAIRMIVSIPCSVYAFRGGSIFEHLTTASLFGAIPFGVAQAVWMRRHKTYWDAVRGREKLRRQQNSRSRAE